MTPRAFSSVTLVLAGLCTALTPGHGQQLTFLNRDLKQIESWAREDTNDFQREYYLALAHWKRRQWREADSLLRFTARMEPRYPEVYLALAELPYARRSKLGDEVARGHVPKELRPVVEEAWEFRKKAFRTSPMVSLEIMGIDVEEPRASDYSLRTYQAYLRYFAWRYDLFLGRYRSAYQRLTSLAQTEFDEATHPERVPDFVLEYRGLAAAHSLQYDAAIADFRTLLDRLATLQQKDAIVPVALNDNDYRFMLATLYHLAGRTDTAIALYQESLEHDLGLVMAHTYLANIYEQAGRQADALVERQRAAELNDDDPATLFDLAASLFNTGQVHEAVTELYRALALNDRYAPPYYLLGRAAEAFGQPDQAGEQYRAFLARAPLRMEILRADAQQRLDKLPK